MSLPSRPPDLARIEPRLVHQRVALCLACCCVLRFHRVGRACLTRFCKRDGPRAGWLGVGLDLLCESPYSGDWIWVSGLRPSSDAVGCVCCCLCLFVYYIPLVVFGVFVWGWWCVVVSSPPPPRVLCVYVALLFGSPPPLRGGGGNQFAGRSPSWIRSRSPCTPGPPNRWNSNRVGLRKFRDPF
jgi:hypothetical protein